MQSSRVTRRVSISLAPLALSVSVFAQAPSTGDDVQFLTEQPVSILRGGSVDLDHIQVFQERSGFLLVDSVRVTESTPTQGQWNDEIPAGTLVDVYLIHQDTDTNSQTSNAGWIQFSEEVLGYMDQTSKLSLSDSSLQAEGTLYPMTDGERAKRGLESHDLIGVDWVNGRFDLTLRTKKKVDEIRILTRASNTSNPFNYHCFGDGSSGNCPCGNNVPGGTEAGCRNSSLQGGRLSAGGSSSVATANFSLALSHLPPHKFGILFMGDSQATASAPFGEGLLCVSPGPNSNGFLRFPIRFSDASGGLVESDVVAYTLANFSGPNQVAVGRSFNYQGYYRDPANSACNGGGFNLTNALTVTFSQ